MGTCNFGALLATLLSIDTRPRTTQIFIIRAGSLEDCIYHRISFKGQKANIDVVDEDASGRA